MAKIKKEGSGASAAVKATPVAGFQKKKPTGRKRSAKSTTPVSGRGRRPAAPFPPVAFSSVLPFAEAIQQHGAGQPVRRLTLFEKLGRSPESSAGRLLIINSGRYGLIRGGYQAEFLELTELGSVVTSPDSKSREKLAAKFKLAIEGIPAFKYLYEKNSGNRVPSPEVLRDSLDEISIAASQRKQCIDLFLENLKDLGLLRTVAGAERIVPIDQALDESPAPASISASPEASIQLGIQRVTEKSKKSWQNTCFVIAPIGSEDSD